MMLIVRMRTFWNAFFILSLVVVTACSFCAFANQEETLTTTTTKTKKIYHRGSGSKQSDAGIVSDVLGSLKLIFD